MAGTPEGGRKTVKTIISKYGEDFYRINGAKGGRKGHTGGFAYDGRTPLEKLFGYPKKGQLVARAAGAKGGRNSRRKESYVSDE